MTHPIPRTVRLRAVRRFARRPRDAWLLIRMSAWASLLPLLKRVLTLPRLVALVAAGPRLERRVEHESRIVELAMGLSRVGLFGSRGNCLERSLVLFRFLSRANANPLLVVGVRASPATEGHAWVVVDGNPVGDDPGVVATYEPLVVFAADGRTVAGADASERAAHLPLH